MFTTSYLPSAQVKLLVVRRDQHKQIDAQDNPTHHLAGDATGGTAGEPVQRSIWYS